MFDAAAKVRSSVSGSGQKGDHLVFETQVAVTIVTTIDVTLTLYVMGANHWHL